MEILDPRAPVEIITPVPAVELGRSLSDAVTVGLRLDRTWRSYETVIDVWQRRLTAAGARVQQLVVGARTGPAGERTQHDLDVWARLVDCGVVGLGN